MFKGTLPKTNSSARAPENGPKPKKERIVSQSSIFKGELLVSGMVVYPCPSYYLQGTVKCTSKRWFFGIPEPSIVWFYSGHWMDITQFLLGPITRFLHIQIMNIKDDLYQIYLKKQMHIESTLPLLHTFAANGYVCGSERLWDIVWAIQDIYMPNVKKQLNF